MHDLSTFQTILALVVSVTATARITRLIVFDHYPPVVWLRITWDRFTGESPWNLLLRCGYCFAPWAAIVVLGTGCAALGIGISELTEHWWWTITTWLTVAYLAAIVTAYDGDD